MKRFYENIDTITELVFNVVGGKRYTTSENIAKDLRTIKGVTTKEVVNGEFILIEYRNENYLVFITDKPYEVISVEEDINFED